MPLATPESMLFMATVPETSLLSVKRYITMCLLRF